MDSVKLIALIDRMLPSCPADVRAEADAFFLPIRKSLVPGVLYDCADENAENGGMTRVLLCPHCSAPVDGSTEYTEDIGNGRSLIDAGDLRETLEDPPGYILVIDGFYETDGYDDGENGRLICGDCSEAFAIPETLEIEFE